MKLIDLLVQELPACGDWPSVQEHPVGFPDIDGVSWVPLMNAKKAGRGQTWYQDSWLAQSTTNKNERATREQYEAALAASHQPAWICGAMPPEGCECEVKSGKDSWTLCKVVHSSSAGVAFIYLEEPNGCASYLGVLDSISAKAAESQFRPIRTEAERRREDLKSAIAELCRQSASNGHSADLIYDAIAAGKIPGVKLDDI